MAEGYTEADYALADALVDSVGELLDSIAAFADVAGTTFCLTQAIGAVLGVGATRVTEPITREDFMHIWDVYEANHPANQARFGTVAEI